MNKKREVEIKVKLDGYLKLLEERLEKTKQAKKSVKKLTQDICKLKNSRLRKRKKSA